MNVKHLMIVNAIAFLLAGMIGQRCSAVYATDPTRGRYCRSADMDLCFVRVEYWDRIGAGKSIEVITLAGITSLYQWDLPDTVSR